MKRNVFVIALLAITLGGLTGCMSNTFEYPDRQADGRVMEESRTFYVGGLIDGNDGPLVAHELCNGPIESVETVHTLGNQCISCISLNIYTPNTVVVSCATGTAHNFYLDENDAVVGHETIDSETGEVLQSEMNSDHI